MIKRWLIICTVVISTIFLAVCYAAAPQPSMLKQAQKVTPKAAAPATSEGDIYSASTGNPPTVSLLTLKSHLVSEGGMLPQEFTCDGSRSTLPIEWTGAPAGTVSFAVVMHSVPGPNEIHWYWILYNIPGEVNYLVKNVTGIGMLGNNSVNGKTEYAPPCSKGPGPKLYTYTLYALSAQPTIKVIPADVSREVLLSAIQSITLADAKLNVYYSR